jgi:putative hydrolase of the HAD superfamily
VSGRDVKILLWDFDGTIVDSEGADATAWREEFARAGVPVPLAVYAGWWSEWSWHRKIRMIDRLAAAAPGVDRDAVEARRRARWEELCAVLPARPGITAWFASAAAAGIRSAVVSNDADGRVPAALARLGLDRYVSDIVTAGEGIARKPAPDLYTAVLARAGAVPAVAVAVEDSAHGIAAAAAAGMRVIAVPNAVTRLVYPACGDVVVDDAARVSLDSVLARLGGRNAP